MLLIICNRNNKHFAKITKKYTYCINRSILVNSMTLHSKNWEDVLSFNSHIRYTLISLPPLLDFLTTIFAQLVNPFKHQS